MNAIEYVQRKIAYKVGKSSFDRRPRVCPCAVGQRRRSMQYYVRMFSTYVSASSQSGGQVETVAVQSAGRSEPDTGRSSGRQGGASPRFARRDAYERSEVGD